MKQSKTIQSVLKLVALSVVLLLLNYIASEYHHRFDLTKEKRYTLSPATKHLLSNLDDNVYVSVYLEGDFPAGFKRLQSATRDLLQEFSYYSNNNIEFAFENPTKDYNPEEQKILFKELIDMGIKPTNLKVKDQSSSSQQVIFPGLVLFYRNKRLGVQLLENQFGQNSQQILNNSIELLEYKIANGILRVTQRKKPHVAFLDGHGELNNDQLADINKTLNELQYVVSRIDVNQMIGIPKTVDVLVIAKPTKLINDKEKFKIDQYIMNGGSVLWLIDQVDAEIDSLRGKPAYMANQRDIGFNDQLYKYGVRINADLVQDLQCNQIPLVVGHMGDVPQTEYFPWYFYPIISTADEHAIVKNLGKVKTEFISTIDTVRASDKNGLSKLKRVALLHSSQYSKALLSPVRLHFGILKERPSPDAFNQGDLPLAWLLEGEFTSLFNNRLASSFMKIYEDSIGLKIKAQSSYAKMIVIGDGDMIKNEISNTGAILPLGYYPLTETTFANKDFILNCIEYLSDNTQLIEARNKEVKLRLLDGVKIKEEKTKWQVANVGGPIVLIIFFGIIFGYIRRKKYTA